MANNTPARLIRISDTIGEQKAGHVVQLRCSRFVLLQHIEEFQEKQPQDRLSAVTFTGASGFNPGNVKNVSEEPLDHMIPVWVRVSLTMIYGMSHDHETVRYYTHNYYLIHKTSMDEIDPDILMNRINTND